jgi:hypothetical protein
MEEIIKLSEAIHKMHNGDIFQCESGHKIRFDPDSHLRFISGDEEVLMIIENMNRTGYIIPAKKDPVSLSEIKKTCILKHGIRPTTATEWESILMRASAENERLIFEPLMEAIQKYEDDDDIQYHESGITEALEKIKQHINPKPPGHQPIPPPANSPRRMG